MARKERRGPGRPTEAAINREQKRFNKSGKVRIPNSMPSVGRSAARAELTRSGDLRKAARAAGGATRKAQKAMAAAGGRGGKAKYGLSTG